MFRERIEPFYFGSSSKPLFGCYHAPQSHPERGCGVVFCYPVGDEYIRFHRAFRQLANRVASIGFPVLRFDFYGCGDSTGDHEQGGIEQWHKDIGTAIDEIRRRCRIEQVCLVGLRLGGTLSILSGIDRGDIDGIVLWDPVVSGKAYIHELKTLHEGMLSYAHVRPKHRSTDEQQTEILGFSLTKSMLTDIENIDLSAIRQKPASNILIIKSHEEATQVHLQDYLKNMGTNVVYQYLPSPQLWIWKEAFGRVRVPHQILQSIVSWLSEVYL